MIKNRKRGVYYDENNKRDNNDDQSIKKKVYRLLFAQMID
jgi:hypothetical protein